MRFLVPCLVVICLSQSSTAWAVSAKEYWAVGNGKADDTLAIQAALDAGQGPVFLPTGRYRLTETLRVPGGGGFYGRGILYMDDDETVLTNYEGDQGASNIRIEGIQIEKRFIDNSEKDGILIQHAANVCIDGVSVTGISACYGIALVHCENFSIANCYIHDFKASWKRRKLPGGRNLDALGITLEHCRAGQISNNRIENLNLTDESAVAVQYQTDGINPRYCKQLTISNNVIRNVGEGIDLVECESVSVHGNVIETCWHFGIKVIHGSRLCTVSHNTISNAALSGISLYFGDPANGPSFGNVVQGNTILNTGSVAIRQGDNGARRGVWKTWEIAGIELCNDSRTKNSVFDYVIANNVIYNTAEHPHCQFGVIERYHTYGNETEQQRKPEAGLFNNRITGNLIRGMAAGKYKTFSRPAG